MIVRAHSLAFLVAASMLVAAVGCGGDDSSGSPANPGGQGGGGSGGSGGGDTGGSAGDGGQAGTGGTGGAGGQAGTGGGGATLESACQASCDKTVAANCSSGPTADACWAGCMNTFAPFAGCAAQSIAFLECAGTTGTVSCDANGVPISSGCESEAKTVNQCTVCEPIDSDGPCKLCGKDKCCAEAQALIAEPTAAQYATCLQGCASDQTCISSCKSTYPAAVAATQAAAQCLTDSCTAECGGG